MVEHVQGRAGRFPGRAQPADQLLIRDVERVPTFLLERVGHLSSPEVKAYDRIAAQNAFVLALSGYSCLNQSEIRRGIVSM